jgi:hypothetical protein
MKIKKLVCLILVLCLGTLSLVGCGKKKKEPVEETQYQEQSYDTGFTAEEYEDAINILENENKNLKEQLAIYDPKFKGTDTLRRQSQVKAGSLEFYKVADKIVLDGNSINGYAAFSSSGLDTVVNFGKFCSLNPNGWTTKLSTDKIELSIDNTAFGKIEIFSSDGTVTPDSVRSKYITKFFSQNDLEELKVRDIYLKQSKIGEESSARILIKDTTTNGTTFSVPALSILDADQLSGYGLGADSDVSITVNIDEKDVDAFYRRGLGVYNNKTIFYEFVYTSNNASTLIDNLINTISFGNDSVYLR